MEPAVVTLCACAKYANMFKEFVLYFLLQKHIVSLRVS